MPTDVSNGGRGFAAAYYGAPRQDNTPAYRERKLHESSLT